MNNDSRQPSICGGYGGITSRRHSSVPREAIGSKTTINTAFGSQAIDLIDHEGNRPKPRPRRILSSIASSSDEPHKSRNTLNKVRESKSLDPLPLVRRPTATASELIENFIRGTKRSTRSLDNCEKCGGDIQIIAIPKDKLVNNNIRNGNLLTTQEEQLLGAFVEDAQMPLLTPPQIPNPVVVRRRGGSDVNDFPGDSTKQKLCHSLDVLPTGDSPSRPLQKTSIKKWLVGIFNGNSFKSSNASLRKGINDYNNLQPDKESIV